MLSTFIVDPMRNFYARFERPISSLSLVGGFVFDILTLKRVDTLWENLWILGHLLILGVFIILIHRQEGEVGDEENATKVHFWYVNILQFFFGGLLSTYLVFYFRSADILSTWPFIFILALAFIANESLKRHYVRLSFQISLFFLSIYSFAIFLIPVMLHKIGASVFMLSGVISLVLITAFVITLFYFIKDKGVTKNHGDKKTISMIIIGIFAVVNFLYFTNLIPPIPLSLKDAGIYNSIQKNADGNYEVTHEDGGWKDYFKLYKDVKKDLTIPTPIYAYTAIFSPRDLNLNIVHEWQRYDEVKEEWITESKITLPVVGGRDGGFRTYSARSHLSFGLWRVNIKTELDQVVGYVRFNLIPVADWQPELITEIKN